MTEVRRMAMGQRLMQSRLALGLTVEDVAGRLGMACAAVKGWERGTHTLHAVRVPDLAEIYGVSCDWIIAGVETVPRNMAEVLARAAQ